MSKQRIIDLGAFPQGALPQGLSYQYLDGDGAPVDLTSGTWTGEAKAEQLHADSQPSPIPGGGAVGIDVPTAVATYTFTVDDSKTVGRFQLILWIGNGTNRLGSATFEWEVHDAPGTVPTV